jgi:hypothetical protein
MDNDAIGPINFFAYVWLAYSNVSVGCASEQNDQGK